MNIDWKKVDGLVPAIIQDYRTLRVLMLGYMNQEALEKTCETKTVTFYSRSKQRLWTKGETSSNTLELMDIALDCDNDTLLVLVKPNGPCCHLNTPTCFNTKTEDPNIITRLEALIEQRFRDRPEDSYVATLFSEGLQRMAQKVGEEGVEVALAAAVKNKDELINEVADLFFHVLILLKYFNMEFADVLSLLENRFKGQQ
jgi:phosphoribosyl-ATP pyrophosphohydrolase/phosphoribosyl-AMP cyclohydrolase